METIFRTAGGTHLTAVTADEMRAVDRVAVEEFGIALLQMMENAGRALAAQTRAERAGTTTVLAGNGGNGGGGLCAARHLTNRGLSVSVVLSRDSDELDGGACHQYEILQAMGVPVDSGPAALRDRDTQVLVDALVGYGLDGPLRGAIADLVRVANERDSPVVSLDVPSGTNATTGERAGPAIDPDRVVTLALPKTGLTELPASLYLADIAIPAGVYEQLDIPYTQPFDDADWVRLQR